MTSQVEKEKASLKKELEQLAKQRDEVWKQQQQLEKSIADTCSTVLDVEVHEEEKQAEKVAKLALVIKESMNKLAKMKIEYEV